MELLFDATVPGNGCGGRHQFYAIPSCGGEVPTSCSATHCLGRGTFMKQDRDILDVGPLVAVDRDSILGQEDRAGFPLACGPTIETKTETVY